MAVLTSEQLSAATRTGQDVCVVAGPGTGKTRVLVERFAWLVENQSIAPSRILTITYTRKAAHEIRRRLDERLAHRPDLADDLADAPVSTIHRFCRDLLKVYGAVSGLPAGWTMLDEAGSQALLMTAVLDAWQAIQNRMPELAEDWMSAWRGYDLVGSLAEVYTTLRATGVDWDESFDRLQQSADPESLDRFLELVCRMVSDSPEPVSAPQRRRMEQLRRWLQRAPRLRQSPVSQVHFSILNEFQCDRRGLRDPHPIYRLLPEVMESALPQVRQWLVAEYYQEHRELLAELLREIDTKYRHRKQEAQGWDYEDLQSEALLLLRKEANIRLTVRDRFDAILVDELQDTNPLQWELLNLIRRPGRFFGVGDPNQSIYGFRHAAPHLFHLYRQELSRKGQAVDYLTASFRSRPELLQAVSTICADATGVEPHLLRPADRLSMPGECGVEVCAVEAPQLEEGIRCEAEWLARRIPEVIAETWVADEQGRRPAHWGDVAVMVRSAPCVPALESAFQAAGVPYRVLRVQGMWEEPIVADLMHLLRVVADPTDQVSELMLLRSPLAGVSGPAVLRLRQMPRWDAGVCWDQLDETDQARLRMLGGRIRHLRERIQEVPAAQALRDVWSPDLMPASAEPFLDLIARLAPYPRPLPSLIADLEEDRQSALESDLPVQAESTIPAVRILTMHGAKGLEFPIVFLAALHRSGAEHVPMISYSPDTGLGVNWRDPNSGEGIPDLAHARFREELRQRDECESDRLLYVAMTRGREYLGMSFVQTSRSRSRWPQRLQRTVGSRPGLVRWTKLTSEQTVLSDSATL